MATVNLIVAVEGLLHDLPCSRCLPNLFCKCYICVRVVVSPAIVCHQASFDILSFPFSVVFLNKCSVLQLLLPAQIVKNKHSV